ncbi:MAG TPA: SBBP repeat-containing protein, partial [Candidatus Elarobacter sp.]|nr:SBBP repeat-containing protein [Candidatus Elarobacter sp.]
FVTKLNPAGSAPLVYSTYLGGSGDDVGQGIAVDAAGNAYVTGYTGSTNFPTTAGAFQSANAGGNDAFVTTLNPAGSAPLVYSTYFGGSSDDFGFGIAVDAAGNAYVTGQTLSTIFPTTPGAFQRANAGSSDAFVTKIAGGVPTCKPEQHDVEGRGHEKGDDGREGEFHFCKSSGEMDFDERDNDGKIVGQPMKGKMSSFTVLGNQAVIIGSGTLANGTPVNYTAVVLGNQPVIGANHFAISWFAANGSVFRTSGPLTDGSIVVQPQ